MEHGLLKLNLLHQLPEAAILTIAGYRRNWVRLWGESMTPVFLCVGLALGWGLRELWGWLL